MATDRVHEVGEPSSLPILVVEGIRKSYVPGAPVLQGIDLAVQAGEIVSLLGPSGCGKTTLLRVVAGLERPDEGRILFQGQDLAHTPVYRRHFGLMFQEFALFPHLTVGGNVAFGLRMARWPAAKIAARVADMLALVQLSGHSRRSVLELSGGERQRVALARSLAPSPRLLMLDEPLGNLDRTLREELLHEVRTIIKRVGVTAIYVTHDQQEAFGVADRLVVMNHGHIEQTDTPEAVHARPANEFVARFLGMHNLVSAHVSPNDLMVAQTDIGSFPLPGPAAPGTYTLLVRPDAGAMAPGAGAGDGPILQGTVGARTFQGNSYRVEVDVPAQAPLHRLTFELVEGPDHRGQGAPLPDVGDPIRLQLEPRRFQLLPGAVLN